MGGKGGTAVLVAPGAKCCVGGGPLSAVTWVGFPLLAGREIAVPHPR